MLSDAAQQSLPQDAQVALQQVDNRECISMPLMPLEPFTLTMTVALKRQHDMTKAWLIQFRSQVFPHICPGGLDTGSVHPKILVAHG